MNNCLVIIRNKKLNIDCVKLESLVRGFSSRCYYFDKTAIVAFDSSSLITSQLKECKEVYENTVIVCQTNQIRMIVDYVSKLYSSTFDTGKVLTSGNQSVFICDSGADMNVFSANAVEILNRKYNKQFDKLYIKGVGAPSGLIHDAIIKARELCSEMSFSVYEKYGDFTIEISYSSQTPKMVADAVQRTFVNALNGYIYALEDITLAQRLFQLLKLRRMKISVAESFTGGGIGQKLVELSGISEVYFEGLNTYSNEAKILRLGVNELAIKQYGAVSDETAYQMAEGLIKTGNCDISIATTGIAGPKSDNSQKPVGLAFIAIGLKERIAVYKFNFKGSRAEITNAAINQALFLAYKTLK